MCAFDMGYARWSLAEEWDRQTYDALTSAAAGMDLISEEKWAVRDLALRAAEKIDWETYDTVRESFLRQADQILALLKDLVPDGEKKDMKRRMYVRFMEGRIRTFEFLEKQEKAKLPPIPAGAGDLRSTEMAYVFARLLRQPETARWLKSLDISWDDEQLHMVTWFASQLSIACVNDFRSRPNHSAKTAYERLPDPIALLWIAAALGEDKDLVISIRHEMDGCASRREKCGVVRRAIPWKRIYELALPLVRKEKCA